MGDMGLKYGNEKRVCTPFDVVLAFLVSVLIVLKFVGEYGKDVATVKNWFSILEASEMIYLLELYTSNVLKRAIKSPKHYFRDTGLVCYLTRWLSPENLAYGAMSGPAFETFVVSEILKSF